MHIPFDDRELKIFKINVGSRRKKVLHPKKIYLNLLMHAPHSVSSVNDEKCEKVKLAL
jgi:hypothetical protein